MSSIDPALGLPLVAERTLQRQEHTVSVVIPAHNEASTINEVVSEAFRGLELLKVDGEVIVSASGCTDDTEQLARDAGASVVVAPIGKGAALRTGLAASRGDILVTVDGDVQYYGDEPLVTLLTKPLLIGIADACVTDLYWRPLYPQLWLHGFFAPIAGLLVPELLPKCGSTPWSGQRAAKRELWNLELPDDFTVDLKLLLHWNFSTPLLRPVLADDWVNPQRPKPDLMRQEFDLLVNTAVDHDRVTTKDLPALDRWFFAAHELMAAYQHGSDDPQEFERKLALDSHRALMGALMA